MDKKERNRLYRERPEVKERLKMYNAKKYLQQRLEKESTQEWKDRQEVLKRVKEIEQIIKESKLAYEKRISETSL